MNIWDKLRNDAKKENRAFTVLAPMEDVTDTVFRTIIEQEGRPDLFFTEFTNTDGLASKGHDKVAHRLRFEPSHKPIIAQIWGTNPDTYEYAIKFCIEQGFDGVDINMGCPVANVVRKGGGAGMIRYPELAQELIKISHEAINKHAQKDFALSVKTRLGYYEIQLDWIEFLLNQPIDALSIHLRTWKEQSKVPAHWESMKEIINLRNTIKPGIVIIGNGDITSREQIKSYYKNYKVDGLMIGRGIFENPWIFNAKKDISLINKHERLNMLKRHIILFINTWGNSKNKQLLKKFFKMYIRDFKGANEIRKELIQLNDMQVILENIEKIIEGN